MTATDRLRALLDERGVEYETDDHMGFSETRWDGACAFQLAPGAGLVMAVTPEQAVEATLGMVECKNVARAEYGCLPGDLRVGNRGGRMKASIRIEYFELLDHWSWEVTVNANSVYGVEDDYDNAFRLAEFALEDLMSDLGIEVVS